MAAAGMQICLTAVVLVFTLVGQVNSHSTPCNQGNDTLCLDGVRKEFVRNDTAYWFGSKYEQKCPSGPDGTFFCMNTDPSKVSIAQRLLGSSEGKDFNTNTIEQFLRIRYNTPAGSYFACNNRFHVDAFLSDKDLDNTHTIYYDQWLLNHRPYISFNYEKGQAYTLIAYDAGYQRMGGMWINIMSPDTATGEEVMPHKGPRNPMWQLRNPFVYALFKQKDGKRITTASSIRADIEEMSQKQDGHYYLENLIANNQLEGPVGIGYVVVKTDAFGIMSFKSRNIFNNCPYLVSKDSDIIMALRVIGFEFTDYNSYSDYRGAFLSHLEVDVNIRFKSKEVHFDSCCQHVKYGDHEIPLNPFKKTPIMPLFTRHVPEVMLTNVELTDTTYFSYKLFTLLLLDVTEASVNATDANTIVHWQVVNIPENMVSKGHTVRPYMPPLPMNRNGTRLFLFLLLKQTGMLDASALWPHVASNCPKHYNLRCGFDFGAFQSSLNLEVVGLSHFMSSQDAFTRAVLYGGINPMNIASSMADYQSMSSEMGGDEPVMTKAEVCDGLEGYNDPCPSS